MLKPDHTSASLLLSYPQGSCICCLKSAERWIKEKTKKLKDVKSKIKAVLTYRSAKRQATASGKKTRKMPAKLRGENLTQLTKEKDELKFQLHHKKRYVAPSAQSPMG